MAFTYRDAIEFCMIKKHFRKGTPDRLISLWNCKKVNYAKLFRSYGRRF